MYHSHVITLFAIPEDFGCFRFVKFVSKPLWRLFRSESTNLAAARVHIMGHSCNSHSLGIRHDKNFPTKTRVSAQLRNLICAIHKQLAKTLRTAVAQ